MSEDTWSIRPAKPGEFTWSHDPVTGKNTPKYYWSYNPRTGETMPLRYWLPRLVTLRGLRIAEWREWVGVRLLGLAARVMHCDIEAKLRSRD